MLESGGREIKKGMLESGEEELRRGCLRAGKNLEGMLVSEWRN